MHHKIQKTLIRTGLFFALLISLFVIGADQAIAQVRPGIDPSNLSTLKVDDLSDEQVMQLLRQGQASGFTIEQAEQSALSRGLPREELEKLRLRIAKIQGQQTGQNVTRTPQVTQTDSLRFKDPLMGDRSLQSQKDTVVTAKKKLPVTIYGQQFFRNSNIRIFESSDNARASDNYTIGIGDEIGISVFGYSYYNEVLKVDSRGAISPSQMGPVYVKGLSFDRAKSLIRSKMGQFFDLSNNRVEVTLAYSRSITINIVGEVVNPGSYKIPAVNTAFNALIVAGGPTDLGTMRNIEIRRAGKLVKTLDVYAFLNDPNSKQDYFLEDNDYIVVGSSSKLVSLAGEVKRPMKYELLPSENLQSLINYSGGLASTAFTENIQVIRTTQKDLLVLDVNLDSLKKAKADFKLLDNDSVTIRKVGTEMSDVVEVSGAVNIPGTYNFNKGDKIADLVRKAGGLRYETLVEKAFLVRTKTDLTKDYMEINLREIVADPASAQNIELQKLDVLYISSNREYLDSAKIEMIGAVRKMGEYDYSAGMTLGSALLMAGGLKIEADNLRIEISRISFFSDTYIEGQDSRVIIESLRIPRDLRLTDEQLSFKLQPFDQVFVRTVPQFEYQQNMAIRGEVKYPGEYTIMSKEERISDVIKRAGGLTRFSFAEGASFFRPELPGGYIVLNLDAVMKNKKSKYNYTLKDGDILTIPTVIDFIGIRGTSVEYLSLVDRSQVNAPFVKGRRAKYYINEFGNGFTRESWKRKTYVIENNSKINKTRNYLFFNVYPKVRKGSTVYVVNKPLKEKKLKKESEPFNWNRFIENTTVKLTGLATLYLLFKQL